MAIGAKILAQRFNTSTFSPITHRIFGIVSDGDLMEGIASEAASLAGHLQLGNVIYLYDDNGITIEGETKLTYSEKVDKRFQAYGWHTVRIDGHNYNEITKALTAGIQEISRPTLIVAKTHIGYGSPNLQDKEAVHGSPLGAEEVKNTKKALGWPLEPDFLIPDDVRSFVHERVVTLKEEYASWNKKFSDWENAHPDLAKEWEVFQAKQIPADLENLLCQAIPEKPTATRVIGGKIVQKAAEILPNLCGGSADLAPSTKTFIENSDSIGPGKFHGRNLHFGIREHAMGGILNGISRYGGIIPYGSTFFVFSDYMRPAIRLSALMKIQVIYIFTHDSIFVGEDGPTHQPIEQLASLRAIPNVMVFRPADGLETAMAWSYAIRRNEGPTVLCLTRQTVPVLKRAEGFDPKQIYRGGYILSKEEKPALDCILVATGSEVSLALETKQIFEKDNKSIRVVSMPSLDVFLEQPIAYQNSIIPKKDVPLVVIEAGVQQGWCILSAAHLLFIGMNRFGASAPAEVLADKFGFTGEQIAEKVQSWLRELQRFRYSV
jgi:transketolase